MATLTSALNYALSGLSVSAAQSALVSRNVSFAGDENYSRKSVELYSLPGGSPAVSIYSRSVDKQLLDKLLDANSAASGKKTQLDALSRMALFVGDPADDESVPARLGKLQSSLKLYEANPSSSALAASVVEQARGLVEVLNASSNDLTALRTEADEAMAGSVERVNLLLAQFKVANDAVTRGTGTAYDLTESLDQRDAILKQLSEEIGIRTVTRPNNDVVIYAEGGAVLFEGSPRLVTMRPSAPLAAGSVGEAVLVDGVAVTGASAAMAAMNGRLPALSAVRDRSSVQLQRQLDEIASALILGFAESDQSPTPSLPDVAGLFVDSSGGLPSVGPAPAGLASRLRINPLVDPTSGGDPTLVGDGGLGGPGYIYNTLGSSSYQERIRSLISRFDTIQTFDPGSGLMTAATIKEFATGSASWIEAQRQTAQVSSDAASAVKFRANESLLLVTGVNVDQEMATLLDLEKSYQASSKVLSVVDSMLAALLQAVD